MPAKKSSKTSMVSIDKYIICIRQLKIAYPEEALLKFLAGFKKKFKPSTRLSLIYFDGKSKVEIQQKIGAHMTVDDIRGLFEELTAFHPSSSEIVTKARDYIRSLEQPIPLKRGDISPESDASDSEESLVIRSETPKAKTPTPKVKTPTPKAKTPTPVPKIPKADIYEWLIYLRPLEVGYAGCMVYAAEVMQRVEEIYKISLDDKNFYVIIHVKTKSEEEFKRILMDIHKHLPEERKDWIRPQSCTELPDETVAIEGEEHCLIAYTNKPVASIKILKKRE